MLPVQAFSTSEHLVAADLKPSKGRVIRALFSLISAALFLRVGGMVNQVVASASFGAGATMDAYFVAAAFPLVLVQLLSSAVEAAVIPVYSRLRLSANQETASRLLCTLINCLLPGALLLALVLYVLRQPLVFFSAPGLDPRRFAQAVILAPLFYLAFPLSLIIGLLECILNAEGQFGWPAYAGLLVPLTTVLLTLVEGRTWGIVVLCLGSLVGTALQLIVVGIRVRQARLRYSLVIDTRTPEFRVILSTIWPVILGALITQGSPLVDQMFASTLPPGSISSLNYALKLVSIFIGVLFVSVGRAMFPALATQAALGDPDYRAFKHTLCLYLWGVGLCTAILSLLLLLLDRPVVSLLFQHGAFSSADTRNTALIFSGFVPGLVPMAFSFLLSRAFNALGQTRVPMYMALVNVGANAFFDALFAHFWQTLGIALATSAVSLATCLLLLVCLYRKIGVLHTWHVPLEIRACTACFRFPCWRPRSFSHAYWFDRYFHTRSLQQTLLYVLIMLVALLGGVIATVHDALATLRFGLGFLLFLCFGKYPYGLLLVWASVNVCIGSFLPVFNGNNLDMALILPVLCLLPFLPWKKIIGRMPGVIWLAFYLLWVLLGINLSPLDARAFLTLWLTMLASIGVGILTIVYVTTRQRLLVLIDVLLATGGLVALYGVYGFITHQRGEVDPDTSLFRVTSLFTQATTLAFYLSSLLPLAFYGCLYLRGARRLMGFVVMLCLSGTLLLTFTRSAYAGVFLGILIMACCLPTRSARYLFVGGLLFFCGIALYLGWSLHLAVFARFFNGDVATFNGRVYLWQALLRNFQVTRWLGSGLQSSDQLLNYLHVGTSGQGVIGTAPHSLFLGTLYDHGVIGLLFLCLAFVSLGYCFLRGIGRSEGEQRMLYAASLASLVNMLLQSLGSRDLWIQAAGVSFWIVIALPFAACWSAREKTLCGYQESDVGIPS